MHEKKVDVFSKEDFRRWLTKNHDKENKVSLILHKKHTGKGSPSHRELMDEAICYGWIDTTIKRLDEDRFIRNFSRRNKNSSWSVNTLSYARDLIKQKRMTPHGLAFYSEGRKKKAYDHGVPKNPKLSADLKKELEKNKTAKKNFENLSPSSRKTYLRWIEYSKTSETRKKRINEVVKKMVEGKKNLWGP